MTRYLLFPGFAFSAGKVGKPLPQLESHLQCPSASLRGPAFTDLAPSFYS